MSAISKFFNKNGYDSEKLLFLKLNTELEKIDNPVLLYSLKLHLKYLNEELSRKSREKLFNSLAIIIFTLSKQEEKEVKEEKGIKINSISSINSVTSVNSNKVSEFSEISHDSKISKDNENLTTTLSRFKLFKTKNPNTTVKTNDYETETEIILKKLNDSVFNTINL